MSVLNRRRLFLNIVENRASPAEKHFFFEFFLAGLRHDRRLVARRLGLSGRLPRHGAVRRGGRGVPLVPPGVRVRGARRGRRAGVGVPAGPAPRRIARRYQLWRGRPVPDDKLRHGDAGGQHDAVLHAGPTESRVGLHRGAGDAGGRVGRVVVLDQRERRAVAGSHGPELAQHEHVRAEPVQRRHHPEHAAGRRGLLPQQPGRRHVRRRAVAGHPRGPRMGPRVQRPAAGVLQKRLGLPCDVHLRGPLLLGRRQGALPHRQGLPRRRVPRGLHGRRRRVHAARRLRGRQDVHRAGRVRDAAPDGAQLRVH